MGMNWYGDPGYTAGYQGGWPDQGYGSGYGSSMTSEQQDLLQQMYDAGNGIKLKELEQQFQLGQDQINNSYKEALLRSGDTRAATEEAREYHRGQLAQMKDEMERIGIPDMLIRKYTAEKNYEIASGELGLKRDMFAQSVEQFAKQFGLNEAEVTGFYSGNPTLARQAQEAADARSAGQLTGYFGGAPTLARQQFEADAAERDRRFGLDVAKYGTDLASQPDTYFQARRFQANDLPRLLGQTPGDQAGVPEAPTSQVGQMGTLLSQGYPASTVPVPYQPIPGPVLDPSLGTAPGGAGPIEGPPGGTATPLDTNSAYYRQLQEGIASGQITQQQAAEYWAAATNPQGQAPPPGTAPYQPGGGAVEPGGGGYFTGTKPNLGGGETGTGALIGGTPDQQQYHISSGSSYGGPSVGYARPTANAGAAPYGGPSMSTRGTGYGYPRQGYPGSPGAPPGRTSWGPQQQAAPDPRIKQIAAIAKAVPPSPYDGLDEQDAASLRLMEQVYKRGGRNIQGGTLESMSKANTGFLGSAGRLLGYDPNDLTHEYQAYRPAQSSGLLG